MSYNILTGNQYLSAMHPPGALLSYVGSSTDDPAGWVICNGSLRSNSDNRYNNLIGLGIGSGTTGGTYTPPNLNAAFLRGTGTDSTGTYSGPSLKAFQQQQIINHGHSIADHTHNTYSGNTYYAPIITNTNTIGSVTTRFADLNLVNNYIELNSTNTSSTDVTSNSTVTTATGGTETRPYNYGVCWILKL
jgi:hypothetical protein